MIDEGVVVDSHLLHADLPGDAGRLEFSGTVTFADPIIGMIVTNESLSATDERLGAAGTFYGMDPFREPDLGFDSARVAADPRVLEVSLAVDTGLDQIRVLTSPGDVPIPEDAAVMPEDAAVDPEDAAVDALGDATVPPIDEPSGAQFRGAGGCACDASGGQPMTETASFIAIFLVLLARRRR